MKTIEYVVENPLGIHARPAALIAQACTGFKSEITISTDEKTASGANVLQILSLRC